MHYMLITLKQTNCNKLQHVFSTPWQVTYAVILLVYNWQSSHLPSLLFQQLGENTDLRTNCVTEQGRAKHTMGVTSCTEEGHELQL
jgi:hypothetical protein